MLTRRFALLSLLLMLAAPAGAQTQRMAVPSYFYPGALWTKLGAAAPTVGLAIINPGSGTGDKINTDYQAQVKAMQAKGILVLCYVHTSYGKRDAKVVQDEMGHAFAWYAVNGIFLDEVSSDKAGVPYFAACRKFIKAQNPKALAVLNPGNQVDEGYMAVSDVVCNYESGYDAYVHKYTAPAWLTKYPARRFWHIVLSVPTEAQMREVVRLSKQRHAGWLFVTPYGDPNPYDKLPEEPYWSGELAALKSK